jgi:hypothetical protein
VMTSAKLLFAATEATQGAAGKRRNNVNVTHVDANGAPRSFTVQEASEQDKAAQERVEKLREEKREEKK